MENDIIPGQNGHQRGGEVRRRSRRRGAFGTPPCNAPGRGLLHPSRPIFGIKLEGREGGDDRL